MHLLRRIHWSAAPAGATPIQKKNFLNVQIDAVGIGVASAAGPFLPVFLTRMGATNAQVGLLSAMPAFAGLALTLALGRLLQNHRTAVPWLSLGSLLVIAPYTLTGVVPFLVPQSYVVPVVLLIWAIATIPQTMRSVAFTVVMNAVAGPRGRYALMSRRWSILGLTSAVMVTVVGQLLDRLRFPVNYQLVFIGLSVGGLISYHFAGRVELPDTEPSPSLAGLSLPQRFKDYLALIRHERAFLSFTAKRLVYVSGATLGVPLFPLYYVREVRATDAWIGIFSTSQQLIALLGYFLWARQVGRRGSRFVLLCTTFSLALYPALTASTHQVTWIALFAGLAGLFQAGLNLVFFDELMKTVPVEHSPTFVSVAQSLQHLVAVVTPLLGTALADRVGIGNALIASAIVRLMGFALFAGSRSGQPAARLKWKRVKRRSSS